VTEGEKTTKKRRGKCGEIAGHLSIIRSMKREEEWKWHSKLRSQYFLEECVNLSLRCSFPLLHLHFHTKEKLRESKGDIFGTLDLFVHIKDYIVAFNPKLIISLMKI